MPVLNKCRGLITFPNEVFKEEGALEIADNVVIDANDTIEPRRGFADFGSSIGIDSDRIKQILQYKGRILRHYKNTLEFDSTGQGNFSSFSGTFDEVEDGLRIKSLESQSNLYFTTKTGIKKISATSASNFSASSGYVVDAGVVKAVGIEADLKFTEGGFLPPQSKCAYRVLWGYRDTNNVLHLGAPSERFVLINTSADVKTPEAFTLSFLSATPSDYSSSTGTNRYVSFSSKDDDYFIWFKDGTSIQPVDSGTISKTAIEVDITGAASADEIAARTASVLGNFVATFDIELSSNIITITSLEEGENLIDASSSSALTQVTTSVIQNGSLTAGQSANAEITFSIPTEIQSTDYFYQIYRTSPVTVTEGVTLEDIDPGDEMNLTLETNLTQAEITAGIVTVDDIITEQFRSSGAYLYTNPNTGEGILQANERPPIAKDIALFRNYTFYANTKSRHKKQFNLLSVSGFTSGLSNLIIGNSSVTREYTFVGATQVQSFDTVADVSDSLDGKYFLINTARNEIKYYVWFSTGAGAPDPAVTNRVGLKVIIDTNDSANDNALSCAEALGNVGFTVSVLANNVEVTWDKNGNVDDAVDGNTGFTFNAPSVDGDGEDKASQDILLSSLVSVGQAIEETALSIIRIVNADTLSPVNAYYLSSTDDLPGIVLFESRSLEDDAFYVATSDSSIESKFNPTVPVTETITAISATNPAQITSAGHGLTTGDKVYIYNTDSTPVLLGSYDVTVIDPNTFSVNEEVLGVGTTGIWFLASFSSDNSVSPNRVYYSKLNQPEAVPILNYIDVGPKDSEIKRIIPLRDNLFALKSDGVYIITGSTAPNFGARLLDGSVKITAPDTAVVLNNKIYCLSSEGVVSVTEGGVGIVSRNIEDKILGVTNFKFNNTNIPFSVAYDTDRAFIVWLQTRTTDEIATQAYRYNTFTQTWTRWTKSATCALVGNNDKLYIGDGDRNFLMEERKNFDRTDYSDRDFTLSIPVNAVSSSIIEISSTQEVNEGDVIRQLQTVTVSQYNRLLLKLDIDVGLDDTDYFSSLQAFAGDSMSAKLDALNDKLVLDDSSGVITPKTFSSDITLMQQEYNILIAELNNASSDVKFNNYSVSSGTVPFEAIVIEILDGNKVTLNYPINYLVGDITVYKGIDTDILWSAQHFGSADLMKQIREGTIIFDQNNFYGGSIGYNTDRSQNFEYIDFLMKGIGSWGDDVWGENTFGGLGSEIPKRTLIPKDKQRCRYIRVRYKHINARETFRVIGVSLEPRQISKRAYR